MTAIASEILDLIAQPCVSDDDFNAMALKVFAHQFTHNVPFQRYCQQRGKTPRLVKTWQDIPAVPINAFKDLTLSCEPPDRCERVFMTSGTTRGDIKGRHYHPNLAVYDASMLSHFSQRVMPGRSKITLGVLFPTEQQLPNSSLAHYLALAKTHFGDTQSDYFFNTEGLRVQALCHALEQAQQRQEPFALLGASYSFVHLIDALEAQERRFTLPTGSFLLDTGGFKGQSREIPMADFYQALSTTFGVPRQSCLNMYGMTELSTQFYDAGNQILPSIKRGAHWIRSRVVDPLTGQAVTPGQRGILAHTDLANYNSVVTILTEDVGLEVEDGFVLLGRAQGAQAKGCSLAVDAFLKAAQR